MEVGSRGPKTGGGVRGSGGSRRGQGQRAVGGEAWGVAHGAQALVPMIPGP